MRTLPRRKILKRAPEQGEAALNRIELDTLVGMGISNMIALAIMITTAATLNVNGVTDVETSAQAAEALRPIAGAFAETIFALGIVGTGLLAVPVLAGSAAYAIGEARKWPVGLARQPMEAKAFYATVALATLVGMILNFTPMNPIKALYWSAVINGVVAVPVMVDHDADVGRTKDHGPVRRHGLAEGARLGEHSPHGCGRDRDARNLVLMHLLARKRSAPFHRSDRHGRDACKVKSSSSDLS